MVEVERLNRAVLDVCNFFELLGYLQRLEALQAESVWNSFGVMSQAYWLLCKPALEKRREERADPTLYEDFERLNRLGTDLARERGIAAHRQEWLRRIMTDEAVIGEEPPTATDQRHLAKRKSLLNFLELRYDEVRLWVLAVSYVC